ncbi:MAG: hypothetical protein NT108_02185 [Candidatus Kaiserbacteria bacterium]|nr:hypothetical protein [Candidatus Kaiserbacteria bacterium]
MSGSCGHPLKDARDDGAMGVIQTVPLRRFLEDVRNDFFKKAVIVPLMFFQSK